MKTPREILLNRHRAAKPALDSIRQQVLESELGRAEAVGETLTEPGWLTVLWQQLVLPCRSAWAGMAAAWAVVLLLRLSVAEPTRPVETPMADRPGDLRAQLKQQWLLREELLGAAAVKSTEPTAGPGPQSEAVPVRTTVLRQNETAAA